jgi:predicted DNA-binding transcriptional regulator YafY
MKLLYYRYNKQSERKFLENKKKFEPYYDKIIGVPVTSGRKLLKKEVKAIEEIFKIYRLKKMDIYYLHPQELEKLPPQLANKVEIIPDSYSHEPARKFKIFFEILKEMKRKGQLCLDEDLEIFTSHTNLKTKQSFINYMEQLRTLFDPLIFKERRKEGNCYRLREADDIVIEILEEVERLDEITPFLSTLSPKGQQQLSEKTKELIQQDREVIIFKSRPFENLTPEVNRIFKELKRAIIERKYVNIFGYAVTAPIDGYQETNYLNVVPLKIVFMENNWYLAGVVTGRNGRKLVRFFRLSFIHDVDVKGEYPLSERKERYLQFLNRFETPFTLFGEKWKKAKLKVHPSKVPYFKIKEQFPKQKILDDREENFIIEVGYTQPLEILPTLKKWIPFVRVIESEDGSIEEALKRDLERYLHGMEK